MDGIRRPLRLPGLAALVLMLMACEGRPTSPSAPPASPPPAIQATASIRGTLVSGSATSVAVAGTGILASIGSDRAFALTGVPPGSPQLHFTGGGADAAVTVNDVKPNDDIRIVVAIDGPAATIQSDSRTGSPSPTGAEVGVRGPVSAVTGNCPAITIAIGAERLTTSAATRFKHVACEGVRPGITIEADGWRQPDGSVAATEVELESTTPSAGIKVKIEASIDDVSAGCPTLTLGVGGRVVTTSGATRYKKVACGDLRPGLFVEVEGLQQPDGAIAADEVELDAPSAVRTEPDEIKVRGAVEVNGACPNLTLSIAARTISTNAATKFDHARCADIRPGTTVKVEARVQGDGSLLAAEVEADSAPAGGVELEAKGSLGGLVGGCQSASFTVSGVSFVTDAATRFRDGLTCGGLGNGLRVEATGILQGNGTVLATRIERD